MNVSQIGSTIKIFFTTHLLSGETSSPSASFEAVDFVVHKGSTEKASSNGIAVTSPLGGREGNHLVEIDTSVNTGDSGFWELGGQYTVSIQSAKTIDGIPLSVFLPNGFRLAASDVPLTQSQVTSGCNDAIENNQLDEVRDMQDNLTDGINAVPAAVDAQLLDAGDATDLIASIVARIDNTNVNETVLVAAIRSDLERSGGSLDTLLSRPSPLNSGDTQLAALGAISSALQDIAANVRIELERNGGDLDTLVSRPSPLSSSQTQLAAADAVEAGLENVELHEVDGKLNAISNAIAGISSTSGPGSIQTTITCQSGGNPVAGVEVWISTDQQGNNVVAGTLVSDDFGKATFLLDVGTYFVWRDSVSHQFPNPVQIEVNDA